MSLCLRTGAAGLPKYLSGTFAGVDSLVRWPVNGTVLAFSRLRDYQAEFAAINLTVD